MSRNDLAKLERLRSVWDAAVSDAARTSAWDTADAALDAYHAELKKAQEENEQ